ncbi:MAG TPA: GNAT family N-acetyltransferase [Usitatibacter sp.]|nr:GNAT family N-acetyltransferase [Usitatibacter sp.]
MIDQITVARLAQHPHLVPTVARWLESEWPAYYGGSGAGRALRDVESYCNEGSLPLGVVAFRDEAPCGFAALKSEPFANHADLMPWAGAAYVAPSLRGKGIGGRLFDELERQALALGYRRLYCATATSTSLLRRRGWHPLDRVAHEGETVEIFAKNLQSLHLALGTSDPGVAIEPMDRTAASLDFALSVKKLALGPYIFDRWGWNDALQRRNALDRWKRSQPYRIVHAGEAAGIVTLEEAWSRLVIDELYVLPPLHRRGIGSRVLRAVLAAAAERQVEVTLQCLKWNAGAVALYRRHGFDAVGETETHLLMASRCRRR